MGSWIHTLALKFFNQRRPVQLEQLRCPRSDAVGFAQGFHNEMFFVLFNLSGKIDAVITEPDKLFLEFGT